MTAKEYLNQAYLIDQRINNKLEQVASLHALATKATTTLNDSPVQTSHNNHKMEDVIMNIMALEEEINADIDELVDIKREITGVINELNNPKYQVVLEKRYLALKSWEAIAVDMNCGIDNVFKLHKKALEAIKIPKKFQKN